MGKWHSKNVSFKLLNLSKTGPVTDTLTRNLPQQKCGYCSCDSKAHPLC